MTQTKGQQSVQRISHTFKWTNKTRPLRTPSAPSIIVTEVRIPIIYIFLRKNLFFR